MSSDDRLIATRYVEALFAYAADHNEHDAVKADMKVLKSMLAGSAEFRRFLTNPIIGREDSAKAMAKVLDALKACDVTRRFFTILSNNRRLDIAPLAIDGYLERLAASRGELTVQVTSAEALSEDALKVITDAIAKATGKKVEAETREDPSLIGGLKVRVGSSLLDTSISGKLARLKQNLSKAA